ncbi:oxygen-independent coproporphyrinogen III oxidase [Flavobacterium sp. xlx-214]|uniref:oxygen-independent coproporphyrinogen III oxidase n=1 Tax=unclassified Flavobacterium TaxID=196869 RepID=UPI0013CFA487|nr:MULTISPECIES: oxygen-independent coproporphyrinogen III oxidase [unclassified Flavobacterium]MBA5791630.1 oxygen-independent coproporphyrinogen III oxidase [Flavobacterium sp. xlx-221]QMI82875.1 oxygen-independent coproporphyrinogen III oxidase [Flavobacterium sp. xlx-214]
MKSLITKYNVPGPRYTSYPTVPFWNQDSFSLEEWKQNLKITFNKTNASEGISLYIHLPFCESLCTFCGCHKHITKRHDVETPYINAVLTEWKLYLDLLETKPIIKELHLGGGTPTFFSTNELKRLIEGILSTSVQHKNSEFSFEGHPNNTTKEHLETLYNLGFKRVSFGVQDYNETVQKAINRQQTFEQVEKVTKWAREIGYTSISHDIIYGLPFQTQNSIKDTIEKTNILSPDRISFYSYAHVPWIKGNGQRGFNDEDIPKNDEKRALYELGKELLQENGYLEIGMDHFSKTTDSLYQSFKKNSMHRNFMGYTSSKTSVMIGLGTSSISDSVTAFAQNEKNIKLYQEKVANKELPVVKGHILTREDNVIRQVILDIICQFQTNLKFIYPIITKTTIKNRLAELKKDELIFIENDFLYVTDKGKTFVRNICMAFDNHLINQQPTTQLFSMTI